MYKVKMMRNIYRRFLGHKDIFGRSDSKVYGFSTRVETERQRVEDWEYVQLISKQIKNNDVNGALKYLIQSHLNKQILNKQIYYSLQQKMSESSVGLGYHQILYKLYRQHFQPNAITLQWMRKISRTGNQKLLELLKRDFHKLDEAFPLEKEEEKRVHRQVTQSEEQQQDEKGTSHGRKSRKVPTIPTTDEYFTKTPQAIYITKKDNPQKIINQKTNKPQKLQKQPTRSEIQIQTGRQVQGFLQSMFKEYGRVTLHDVVLEFDSSHQGEQFDVDEEMNTMYEEGHNFEHDEGGELEEGTMDDYVLEMLSTVSKIKIGRIELHEPQFLAGIRKQDGVSKGKDDQKDD